MKLRKVSDKYYGLHVSGKYIELPEPQEIRIGKFGKFIVHRSVNEKGNRFYKKIYNVTDPQTGLGIGMAYDTPSEARTGAMIRLQSKGLAELRYRRQVEFERGHISPPLQGGQGWLTNFSGTVYRKSHYGRAITDTRMCASGCWNGTKRNRTSHVRAGQNG